MRGSCVSLRGRCGVGRSQKRSGGRNRPQNASGSGNEAARASATLKPGLPNGLAMNHPRVPNPCEPLGKPEKKRDPMASRRWGWGGVWGSAPGASCCKPLRGYSKEAFRDASILGARGDEQVCRDFPGFAVADCGRGQNGWGMETSTGGEDGTVGLTFVGWVWTDQGIRLLCRCGCGRPVKVRVVEFTKSWVRRCAICECAERQMDTSPAARLWLLLGLRERQEPSLEMSNTLVFPGVVWR